MEIIKYQNETILSMFPPQLRDNFEELFSNGKIGLSSITSAYVLPLSVKIKSNFNDLIDNHHFIIKIPYAGKRLSWELIFNPEDYTFAPDFDFNDENFLSDPNLDEISNQLTNLVNWNVNNSKCLTLVLEDFIKLYKTSQIQKLSTNNIYAYIHNEYKTLINEIHAENVEVLTENNSVQFFIKLKVDCSALTEYMQANKMKNTEYLNPGECAAHLKVIYTKLDGTKNVASLYLSAQLEQTLGSSKTLNIPNFTKDLTLLDYVQLISALLKDSVEEVEKNHTLRKQYINHLVMNRGKSMIEFDWETYSKAIFLCEVDDYYCLVDVQIDEQFPKKKPTVTLRSLYCVNFKRPCVEIVKNYPYNPKWTCESNVKRLMGYLADDITKFKNHKH